jgi:2'-5' RNA ligase
VTTDALHVTLKFLGDVDAAHAGDVMGAVTQAVQGARPFAVGLAAFGAFPTVERPRVIWVGCDGVPAFELLQHRLELEMERVGFPVEARPFRPHITLGRVRRDAKPRSFRDLEHMLAGLTLESGFVVSSVDLMESRTGPDGSAYSVIHSAALAGQGGTE